jgi:XTP/dITP diphosphohydrolase
VFKQFLEFAAFLCYNPKNSVNSRNLINSGGMKMEIVLATRNTKKVEEIKRAVGDMPISIMTIDDFPGCPEAEEDGITFQENAVKKAIAVAYYTGKPSLADDSGLEVYVLNNAPGILSSRYSGEGADDSKNIEKLLNEMRAIIDEKRNARFVCCLALAFPDGRLEIFTGQVEGKIGREQKGSHGFGYDPIFYPKGHDRTFAEMSADEKDSLSHRGEALREFQKYLKSRGMFNK